MERTFRIHRQAAPSDAPRLVDYRVPVEPSDRILDCLQRIRAELDPTLAFRMSCAHGVCGSDAMRIAGVCALACQRLVKDYPGDAPLTVEPLPTFPVLRDLIVDLRPFYEKLAAVRPWLSTRTEPPERERLQSPADRAAFEDALRCILCGCCAAACPVTPANPGYVGPAALLRTFRFLLDTRDEEHDERLAAADHADHAGGCRMHGRCTEVCPKEIPVQKCLAAVKRRVQSRRRGVPLNR